MAEIIAAIILLGSLCGIGAILFRKIPALKELPIDEDIGREGQFTNVAERIKQVNPFGFTCFEKFLKKFLLRVRIFSLKTENAVNALLKRIREKQQRKNDFSDYSGSGNKYDVEDNRGDALEDDIEDIKNELKNKIEAESEPEQEPKPEPEPKPDLATDTITEIEAEAETETAKEKDNYWEELKKIKKKKTTRRRGRTSRKKKD